MSFVPADYVPPTAEDFAGWTHWFPPGYPITDRFHNPWIPIDPISGMTAFNIWSQDRSMSEEQFRQKLDSIVNGEPWSYQDQAQVSYADGTGSDAPSAGGSYIDRLIARSHAVGVEASLQSHEMPLLRKTGDNGSDKTGNGDAHNPVSRQVNSSARNRAARMFPALVPDDSGSLETVKWSKVETAIAAKCKECDRIIAKGEASTSSDVFSKARIHAERESHTVVIRQVQRVEVCP